MMRQRQHLYDVFISYSRADAAWVHECLLPQLEAASLHVCLDTRDFEIGTPLLVNMEHAIEQSRYTLLVLTPAWIESQWRIFEALLGPTSAAVDHQRIRPLLLQPIQPPPPLARLRYTDCTDPQRQLAQIGHLIALLRGQADDSQLAPTLQHLLPDSAVTQFERNCRILVRKVRSFWIDAVLDDSLRNEVMISFDLVASPAAVVSPIDELIQRPDRSDYPLPQGTTILQVYDQHPGGLLILGAPGAGKTTLLLELTRHLLDRAARNGHHPIPVVFLLSTWAEQRQSLDMWLVDELNKRYDIPRKLAQTWVDAEHILPLLDGLDEVDQQRQAACVEAINSYRRAYVGLPLVVCSRSTDYHALTVKLRFQGAITAQPLTLLQVETYLKQCGPPMAALRAALRADPTLQELLSTPLMLHIVTLTYAEQSVETIVAPYTSAERYQPLFSAYTRQVLARRSANHPYTPAQTLHWLGWLACQMQQHNQMVFYIEGMQPTWLPRQQRWLPTRGVALVLGLAFGLTSGYFAVQFNGPVLGLIWGCIEGLFVGFVVGYSSMIESVEVLRWSRSALRLQLIMHKGLAVITSLVFGLLAGPIAGLLSLGVLGFMGGLDYDEVEIKVQPNQGIRHSLRYALLVGLLIGGLFGIVSGLVEGPFVGLVDGMLLGLMMSLGVGGRTCIQHLVLRRLLVLNGTAPWNYQQFLDYAASRILLRKVGGGYIFIHRLLLEHFAAQYRATERR